MDFDLYLRFRRAHNEPMLDSTVDYKKLIAQYNWLEQMYRQDNTCVKIAFQGPGIERIVSIEGRNYMTFAEVVRAFHLYADAMWRFTYYPLDMTEFDHMISALIETFCEKDLSSNNYIKWRMP